MRLFFICFGCFYLLFDGFNYCMIWNKMSKVFEELFGQFHLYRILSQNNRGRASKMAHWKCSVIRSIFITRSQRTQIRVGAS